MHKSYNWCQKICTTKTCSLDEFDEKPNHTKISKSWNFEGKGCKAKDSFFWPFDKKYMFMGSKCLAINASHMWRK
jgi:hypothetical protein